MTAKSFATLLPLLAALALSACVAPPAPKDTFYRLEAALPPQHYARPPLPGVLEVERVETEGVLSERAIAYLSAPGALQRYAYEYWADPPGMMLQDAVARALRQADVAATVVTPDLRVVPGWTLRAKLLRFEQVPQSDRVAVTLRVAVLGADDSRLVLQHDYAAEAPTAGESPAAAAAAMGTAVADVLARLVADLGAAGPGPGDGR
jgi:ABC-type uncharacterized transport system auxiliary subunit